MVGNICTASCNYPFLFPWQCDILRYVGNQFDFSEFSSHTEAIEGTKRIEQRITTLGLFFSNEDKSSCFWHAALPEGQRPPDLVKLSEKSEEVQHVFEGDEFLLVRAVSGVAAFNLQKYRMLQNLLNELDYYLDTPLKRLIVDTSRPVLIMESTWMSTALAGLSGDGYDDEERVRLSERLATSQPFFEYKAPIIIPWQNLKEPKDETFQELSRVLLERDPLISTTVPIGKARAADRGRDLHVIETARELMGTAETKWLVQCKYSQRSVSPDTIKGWTDRIREHGYDGFWLMTNNDITPNLFDQFNDVEKNTSIRVRFWQRSDFERKLNVYSELVTGDQFFTT